MTEKGEEAGLLGAKHKQSKRERFRDRLLKKADKPHKTKAKEFQSNADLDEFLLKAPPEDDILPSFPSPSRKSVPRISVSSSTRWPNAQDVTKEEGIGSADEDTHKELPNLAPRRKRRKGLKIRFAETAAEIIGEGGDDAETPTIWISQAKQSSSTRPSTHDGPQKALETSGITVGNLPANASGALIDQPGDEVRPRTLERAPTGFAHVRAAQDDFSSDEGTEDAGIVGPVRVTVQDSVQSDLSLLPSSAAGLKQKMFEEEARALTSGLRDASPEPFHPEQNGIITGESQENLQGPLTASHDPRSRSPSTPSILLFPSSLSSSPPRPSSFSSHESVRADPAPRHSFEDGRSSPHAVPSFGTVPNRKPLPKSPTSETKQDALANFRLYARRYYGLFGLAVKAAQPGLNAPLSRWVRAAAWWFLTAETNFKQLRKDLEEGANISQVTSSRRHMQAMVDLAKTAWIVEDMVQDYSRAEFIDLSTPGSIERLIQNDPCSRFSLTLQYWQDLCGRFASLVAAVRRNGFMTSTSEDLALAPGIDTTIWLTSPVSDPRVAHWFRSANPLWVKMDDTVTPVEPFDLAKTIPLTGTVDTLRMKSMFCQTSGGFQDDYQSPNIPCILTIARRRGSYALVLFVASQDHGVNVVLETDPVRGDGIDWQPTELSVHFNFADGFHLLIQLQPADYLHLKECYSLAMRALTATLRDTLDSASQREELIFRATARTFERRSVEKLRSFPYEGEQKDCEILLLEKHEVLGATSSARNTHRGFRLSVMLSPYSVNFSILDVHLGGDKPIILHTVHEHSPLLIELIDSRRASLLIQFSRNQDFNRFYELLTSFGHFTSENIPRINVPLRSFTIEPSSNEARTFFSGAPWRNMMITTGKGQSSQSTHNMDIAEPTSINISVFSSHAVIAERLCKGVYTSLCRLLPLSY